MNDSNSQELCSKTYRNIEIICLKTYNFDIKMADGYIIRDLGKNKDYFSRNDPMSMVDSLKVDRYEIFKWDKDEYPYIAIHSDEYNIRMFHSMVELLTFMAEHPKYISLIQLETNSS